MTKRRIANLSSVYLPTMFKVRWIPAALLAGLVVVVSNPRAEAIDAVWELGAVGAWSDAGNWDSAVPNNSGGDVYDVFIDGNETVSVVDIDGAYVINNLTWEGGTLTGSGTLTVEGVADLSGATKAFAAATINLEGGAVWSDGVIQASEPSEGGTVNNAATFDIQWDAFWGWLVAQTPVFNNLAGAELLKSSGTEYAVLYPEVNNAGTIHVQSGGLHLAGGGVSSGLFLVDEGASLDFSDFNQDYAAAGSRITELDAGSQIDASAGGLVRFTNSFGDAHTDVFGAIDATVVEIDPGVTGSVVFHGSSSYGAAARGSLSANSGTTTFAGAQAAIIDLIVNNQALVTAGDGAQLNVGGAINVNPGGLLTVGDGDAAATIQMDDAGPQLLTGSGEIALGHAGSSLVKVGAASMTIDEELTVRGTGLIFGAGFGATEPGVNWGRISADVAGKTLRIERLSNEGTIEGTDGGTVDFRNAVNTGAITVAGGGALITNDLQNSGDVTIDGGTLELNGNGWVNGPGGLITAINAAIMLRGDFTVADVGAMVRTNSDVFLQGTLQNTGATLDLDNSTGEQGTWIMNGGTNSRVVGGAIQTSGGAQFVLRGVSGILQNVTLRGGATFENGSSLLIAGSLTLDDAILDLSAGGAGAAGLSFTDSAARSISGSGQIIFGNQDNRGIDNGSGPQATIGPGVAIRGQRGRIFGGTNGVVLQGSVAADVAGGFINLIDVTIAPGGVAETKNGSRLQLSGNWDNNGQVKVEAGSTLDLAGTFDTADIGAIVRSGVNTVQLFGALSNAAQTLDLHTQTGTLLLRSGGQIFGGRIQSSGAAELVVNHVDVSQAMLNGVTLATDLKFTPGFGGSIRIEGGLTLDAADIDMAGAGSGRMTLFTGAAAQALSGTGEVLLAADTFRNSMSGGAALTIGPNVTLRGSGSIEGNFSNGSGGINNQGTIRVEGAGATLNMRHVKNTGGLIRVTPSNTLRAFQPSVGETLLVQTGGETSVGGVLASDSGIDVRGGTLSGTGLVQILNSAAPNSFVRVTNGGIVAPGDSLGTLTIDGNVVFGSGGRLAVEISGAASADRLQIVKGQFQTAAGNLDLSSSNDFLDVAVLTSAVQGNDYLIATYTGSLIGSFDHVTPGMSVIYDTANKQVFVRPGLPGDFDSDGDVDGFDFLTWQRNTGLSTGATLSTGDANSDGAVNTADLAIWKSSFGATGVVPAVTLVPEPALLTLAAIVLGALPVVHRRRRAATTT